MRKLKWILSSLAALGFSVGSVMAQEAKPLAVQAAMPAVSAPVVIGCSSGCCTSAPTCYTDSCDHGCDKGGGLLFDIGFMTLEPKFKDNPSYFLDSTGTDPRVSQQVDLDFHE